MQHSLKISLAALLVGCVTLAAAAPVPDADRIPVDVRRTTLVVRDIDKSLPNQPIEVLGPPPTSGTRDAWDELVMEEGCHELAGYKELAKDVQKNVCSRMRQDGLFIEAGENDNLIVQRLNSDPTAYGIFGYSFLYENLDTLTAVKVAGVEPNEATIGDGSYKISRPLFFYVKNAHRDVIPGLKEFLEEYVSDAAMGDRGYLNARGLVPLAEARRKAVQDAIRKGTPMKAAGT